MKLLTHGIRTCWGHDAIVYDEKVTTMMASCRQRLRWAQGQFDCAGRYIPKLFAIGIKTGNIMILDGYIPSESTLFLIVDNRILGVILHQCVYSNLYKYFVSNYAYVCMDNYRCWSISIPINCIVENQGTTKDLVLLFTISIICLFLDSSKYFRVVPPS